MIALYPLLLVYLMFLSNCSNKEKNNSKKHVDDALSDISIYIQGNHLDSLDNLLDFEISNDIISQTEDSINYLYGQLQTRLTKVKGDSSLNQFSYEFYMKLKSSKVLYDSLGKVDAQILGYSYYRATEASAKGKNMYYFLLKQRLFFLKCVLENTYWNYGFDKIK